MERHVSVIAQSKTSLHQMRTYLLQNRQTFNTMTPEQALAYQNESQRLEQSGQLVADTLTTLEKFCRSMPLDWIVPSNADSPSTNQATVPQPPQHDFSAAFLHLLREPLADIQIAAVDCLDQLTLRGRLTFSQWMTLIRELPSAIAQTNQQFAVEQEYATAKAALSSSGSSASSPNIPLHLQVQQSDATSTATSDPLTAQIGFHRALSRMLANVVSSHLSHVTYGKRILEKGSVEWTAFSSYIRLLVGMLRHPSARMCGEQINTWISALRDPQISKSRLLQPFIQEIVTSYMDHMVRLRWEDVEEGTHPMASLMEASWEDEV